ncbi:MAG: alpha/beta hydrolase, partial [Bacteroidales bacterium]|nr:alpha/beta hydrolase [Bacteroidales bacterium]
MKKILGLLLVSISLSLAAQERVAVWPKGKMPDAQAHQIAAMTDEAERPDFNPDKHRVAYLEW